MALSFSGDTADNQARVAASRDMHAQRVLLREILALRTGEQVLEVGAGDGTLLESLLEDVGEGNAAGVDLSDDMVARARARCPGAKVEVADAAELPSSDAQFDALVLAQVMCFLPDPDAALREFRRVLRPGGRLVILDTDWGSLVWNTEEPALMAKVMRWYTSFYTDAHVPRRLSGWLRAAGFSIVDRRVHPILNCDAGPDSYVRQTMNSAASLPVRDANPTDDERQRWIADLEALDARGETLFSLNRYVFTARRAPDVARPA